MILKVTSGSSIEVLRVQLLEILIEPSRFSYHGFFKLQGPLNVSAFHEDFELPLPVEHRAYVVSVSSHRLLNSNSQTYCAA